MYRTGRLRTLHHVVALLATLQLGSGCFLIYGFDAEPPLACKQATDCPGVNNGCGEHVCEQGACVVRNLVSAGVVPLDELRGDCRRSACDGQGNRIVTLDETDVFVDGNPCTQDLCTNGTPSNPPAAAGTQCGTIPAVTCNEMGQCINCTVATECGTDTPCSQWLCENSQCLRNLAPVGTVVGDPVAGDCRKNICDVTGEAPETFSPEDAPSDNDPCTKDICTLQGGFDHQAFPDGTQCGDCQACLDGQCGPCNPVLSDCYAGECISKPQVCAKNTDCSTGYCVDGYCCNSECAAPCMACNNAKTGLPSGLCSPVVDGTDPDDECGDPAVDVCLAGKCQCHDALQNGTETGTDCGGNCAPCMGIWDCGSCVANANPMCCSPDCSTCKNNLMDCQGMDGTSCAIGVAKQIVTLGTVNSFSCPLFQGCKFTECTCK